VQKEREKAWHDRHIKKKIFWEGNLILLYDSKFKNFSRKFNSHWLRPHIIKKVSDGGVVQLTNLNGQMILGWVNGSTLDIYRDDCVHGASHLKMKGVRS